MTDVLERRFQAVANSHDDSSWDDVCRRAGRRPVNRVALLAAATVAVVAVAAPASGLHEPVVDFLAGEPAPERIAAHYSDLNRRSAEWAPHIRFDVVAAETRRVTTVHLSDGTHTLYVAPTREGGFCFMWTRMIGSCDKLGSMPLNVGWGGDPPVVSGTVDAEWVHQVEVRFVDGRVEKPKMTWVSDPIGAGFFAHEVTDVDDVLSVSALDEEGRVLTEQRFRHRQPPVSPPREALVDQKRVALAAEVDGDSMTVWTAPSNTEGRCVWFEFRGRAAAGLCRGRGYAPEIVSAAVTHFAGARFLQGQAPPEATSVDVTFEDGHASTVRPAHGVFVLPLAADDVPARVQGRDADGRDVFSVPLPERPFEFGG
jgi:hypothetical protein